MEDRFIPTDRRGNPKRAAPLLFMCVAAVVGGLLTVGAPFDGVLSHFPLPVARVMHTAGVAAFGLGALVGTHWMLGQRFGSARPVVSFGSEVMTIRNISPPCLRVRRDEVRAIRVQRLGLIGDVWLRLGPLVFVELTDGKRRGVQSCYHGEAEDLAYDIARWAGLDSRLVTV